MKKEKFSKYQKFIIALLAFLQFTVVLDFMVLSPLSAILLTELNITTSQFGLVVSAYALSAGASGILAAGFADKFDRKKLLVFFYAGFIIGTLFCGLAPNYHLLLLARIFTGIFGGVIGAIVFAIITDLFELKQRGRVMGFVQMAFAASQILGIPFGLYLANKLGWHAPFIFIVITAIIAFIPLLIYLKPINAHLALQTKENAFVHLAKTFFDKRYLKGFSMTTVLALGGFMLMPFGAAYSVHNLGISVENLPMVYLITGVFSIFVGPIAGKLSDSKGKFKVFAGGSIIAMIFILIYCNMGVSPLWLVIAINILIFMGITSRMIASQALLTAIPDAKDRGAFMGINSAVMQIAGGIAAGVSGIIVTQDASGVLGNYPILGIVVSITIVCTIFMMSGINKMIYGSKTKEKQIEPLSVAA